MVAPARPPSARLSLPTTSADGSYILDFACLRAQLGIEIDGEHLGLGSQRRHDMARDLALSSMGLRIIRFWNVEIDTNLDSVVEAVMTTAQTRLETYRSGTLP